MKKNKNTINQGDLEKCVPSPFLRSFLGFYHLDEAGHDLSFRLGREGIPDLRDTGLVFEKTNIAKINIKQ